jgi:hypothetical protein
MRRHVRLSTAESLDSTPVLMTKRSFDFFSAYFLRSKLQIILVLFDP